jgi:hypothetical protein
MLLVVTPKLKQPMQGKIRNDTQFSIQFPVKAGMQATHV